MKHSRLIKCTIALVLSVMLMLSTVYVGVSAATTVTSSGIAAGTAGYVNADYVNLRSGAGTSYSVVTCMEKNTKFTYSDSSLYNNSWYKIKLDNGKSGYVYKTYASVSKSAESNVTGYVNADYVNLRSGAGTSYTVLTCMRKNTKFTFVSTSLYNTNWYKIKLSNGTTGYIYKTYATKNSTSASDSSSSSSSGSSATQTVTGYVNADYVNLRSGAGTSYSVLTCMRKNTKFTFVSTSLYNTNWYKIKLSDGTTGYIYKTYATKNSTSNSSSSSSGSSGSSSGSTATQTVTGYVNDDYVNLRSGAGTGYSVVTCMRKNTKFTFVSTSLYNSDWYKIKLSDGTTGYIYKTYATKDTATSSSDSSSNGSSGSNTGNSSSNNSGSTSASVKLSDTSETLYTGNYYKLTATASGSVTWSSSDTSVATVSSGLVYAKAAGTATITAKCGSASATCKITVKNGTSVKISNSSVSINSGKSILLTSSTSGVSWKSSDASIATVNGGIVDTKTKGTAVITAYTSSGAASCVLTVTDSENVRFAYASPNSAPLNSTVTFKAVTDTDKTAVKFVISNGSKSYTVEASSKVLESDTLVWTGSMKLTASGKWTFEAYSKSKNSSDYSTSSGGKGEVFVTSASDTKTTVCAERRASDEIIELIANYEGFLPSLTPDSITSDPTLGYGRVIYSGDQFYNNLTKTEAYAYLCQTVNSGGYTTKVNKFLLDNNIKFNQQQFDALVCFCYNVGASAINNDSDLSSVLLNTSTGTASVTAGASGYVNASDVNLRSGAGTSYSVLTCMAQNTKFTYADGKVYNTNWYKIKLSDGTTGYIYKSYASVTGASCDLNNVSESAFINNFLQYHHAAGSCYWGLLYRRIDEAEVFFYGDYSRDGNKNKYGLSFTCGSNSSFGI